MAIDFGDITDNTGCVPGVPNPTYTVQTAGQPAYTASIAVQGGAAGSGDSGWNPAVALYVLLCAGFPYGCGSIAPTDLDQTALLAVASTMAAERLAVNLLIENGQQADEAIGALMTDVGLLIPQVGQLLKPYLVRTEPTAINVPDDLIDGDPPEQQRQVSNLGGDRFTFQIDDVLSDGATSDVTIDNDAQAAENNRPQAQTIKLATVTCRSVARQVAVRRAVELIAQAHKLPALSLLRGCRAPQFHPGRTFLLQGQVYRITGWQTDTVGIRCEVDATLDQYGDVDISVDPDNDDANQSVPPAAPPAPDLVFDPIMHPPGPEWARPVDTPVFGVPRVRANESGVTGADVWLADRPDGPLRGGVGRPGRGPGRRRRCCPACQRHRRACSTPRVRPSQPYNDDITGRPRPDRRRRRVRRRRPGPGRLRHRGDAAAVASAPTVGRQRTLTQRR